MQDAGQIQYSLIALFRILPRYQLPRKLLIHKNIVGYGGGTHDQHAVSA
jgi:hypothetical protein